MTAGSEGRGFRHAGDGQNFAGWRTIVAEVLQSAHAVIRRRAPRVGQRVVARRAAGYREWDPEVIAVDTAAERAGCVVSHWDGSPVTFHPDIHTVYSLVCSANRRLHMAVLQVLKDRPRRRAHAPHTLHAATRAAGPPGRA